MKKHSKSKSKSPAVPKVDPYLEGVVSKLLDRFIILEKKMDSILAQTVTKHVNSGEQPKQPQQQLSQKRDRTLYEAICADCHKICEVPFKPSESRPVYCKECFAKRKNGGSNPKNFPILTPVAMPPKASGKLSMAMEPSSAVAAQEPKKAKKSKASKKSKRKK